MLQITEMGGEGKPGFALSPQFFALLYASRSRCGSRFPKQAGDSAPGGALPEPLLRLLLGQLALLVREGSSGCKSP